MARTDIHLDAMLRHLGAAYYDSLHGRATRSDVNRALDTVEDHLHEQAPRPARPSPPHLNQGTRHRRWARRVSDVMTTSVVTVDRITSYQEIDRVLTERRISGVPVLKMGRQVAGVVSEADLLAAEDERARQARLASAIGRRWRLRKRPQVSLTAGTLMTAPAITIHPDATIPAAARLMNTHHVRRLPVDRRGRQAGRHREPPRPAERLPAPRRRHRPRCPAGPRRAPARRPQGRHRGGQARRGDPVRDDAARAGPGAGPDPARAPADLGHRRRGRRREQARRGPAAKPAKTA